MRFLVRDEDFVLLHSTDENPYAVCWVRVGNARRKDLLEWFERLLTLIEEKLASGELLVELQTLTALRNMHEIT